jgi:hypothetical protein
MICSFLPLSLTSIKALNPRGQLFSFTMEDDGHLQNPSNSLAKAAGVVAAFIPGDFLVASRI